MWTFGELFDIVTDLPREAMMAFKKLLKPVAEEERKEIASTPAGAVFMGVELLEKLEFSAIVDEVLGEEHTPISTLKKNIDEESENRIKPSVGTILSLVVSDMISKPREVTRIYKIQELAKKWKLFELFGIDPAKLNDDKILRSFSKLGTDVNRMNEILLKLTMKVCNEYAVPMESFLLDSTVMELDGEFKNASKVQAGRGVETASQLITSLIVSANSKIPIGGFVYPGNTNDAKTLPDAIEVINKVVPAVNKTGKLELIMDRIYITAKNVLLMRQNEKIKINWLGPLKSGLSEKRFREIVKEGYEKDLWRKISYRSAKEISRKEDPILQSFEATWIMTDEIKPELESGQKRRAKGTIQKIEATVRCVVYKDIKRAIDEKKAREKRREKLNEKLVDFSQKINKRKLKKLEQCKNRLNKLFSEFNGLKQCLIYNLEVVGNEELIKFNYCWNEEVYKEEEKYDGVFALLTEYSEEEKNSNNLIELYRGRNEIEMNFRDLKGILELERVFIQEPERIDAYIFLKIIAYFVLSFLRWYVNEKCHTKTTESKIQNSFGDINIIEGELSPTGITFCDITGDSQFCKIIRDSLGLSNPYSVTRELNAKNVEKFRKWLYNWYTNWLLEQKCDGKAHSTG